MATVSYRYDIKFGGNSVSQVKVNGTDVKRVKVDGNDVVHKFITYKTTATIKCYIRFSSLKASSDYTVCGDDCSDVRGDGYFFVSSTTSGDSLSDSGGSIPLVEVYFGNGYILERLNNLRKTFSNLDPKNSQTFNNFSCDTTGYPDKSNAQFRVAAFYDTDSGGSWLRTSWGDVNISERKYTPYMTPNTSTTATILLGSISKTFTRTVQEY